MHVVLYICILVFVVYFFFFFSSRRRHTRYWRDWSSDVCSSDLNGIKFEGTEGWIFVSRGNESVTASDPQAKLKDAKALAASRSEERRVGKECRSRWSPYH